GVGASDFVAAPAVFGSAGGRRRGHVVAVAQSASGGLAVAGCFRRRRAECLSKHSFRWTDRDGADRGLLAFAVAAAARRASAVPCPVGRRNRCRRHDRTILPIASRGMEVSQGCGRFSPCTQDHAADIQYLGVRRLFDMAPLSFAARLYRWPLVERTALS